MAELDVREGKDMSSNIAWPIAVAFVGMCFAIAWANVATPPQKTAHALCIEQRGLWHHFGSWCEWPKAADAAQQ